VLFAKGTFSAPWVHRM